MNAVKDLVSELVRAANKAERLSEVERKGLFLRTIVMVRNMRQSIAIPSAQSNADQIVGLQLQVAPIGTAAETPEEVRDALLTAAGMIRELHIILDKGNLIGSTGTP
ncbi:hypothetical protein [Pseudorhizobium pelagicum]|uniref:hypothetical protein n=1 Tax=Pseudorhizobium pelagicum TaxID=1509405 RepID=UPI00068AE8BA|nr:hypothetical protein [Pseudorhizobium pelagicum]